ncbi:recombination protein Rad52 [Metschnikowia bicuspidata var. bicuspidata NRRL YB-4993]|uniref:DNA repair and recombination protein RAD52 n=1 Tax=Metschnikowia bicuspidata var. bicuspidata NRRL YB-4993 TaxID=869754 RepID=A0A1A0HIS4_9ASCO|nr:recombination protein Rad52 [Metschnikowia bicuspidata var. bicuspidata NRRL YB-4993]OBA23787.1 recombination protein Rad52 [Metschnikowia bicuspidata var. bicuspidata NRRL YB-4993]
MNPPPNSARPRPQGAPATPGTSGSRVPPQTLHQAAAKTPPLPAAGTPYTAEEARRIQTQLNRVLGPEYVSCRPGGGGQNVSYIEGWKALNLANEIFGFNGWSSQLVSVQVDYLDSHGGGRVSLGLSVVVRITIRDGTFHEDFGYGNIDNAKNKAMAFEKCKKEAFTDALKRCLRCFGNVLGNCLYDKGIVAKMQKVRLPPLELAWDDFHRDPLVVKREAARAARAAGPTGAPETGPPQPTLSSGGPALPAPSPAPAPAAKPAPASGTADRPAAPALPPALAHEYALDDFDDLFMFSDEIGPADGETTGTTMDAEAAPATPEPGASAPGLVFFTSSKKALDVQKASCQADIPVYDHKFIARSVKRTVDPSRSTKIRRADLPPAHSPSQPSASPAPSPMAVPAAAPGKRPLGMPPSQRPSSKRLHRAVAEPGEQENDMRVS